MTAADSTVPPLVIGLFGPFTVRVNGLPLPRLRARKGEALFLRRAAAEESLALTQETGPTHAASHAVEMLGRVRLAEGHGEAARSLFVRGLEGLQEAGDDVCIAHSLEAFARLAMTEAQPRRAAQLLGAADAARQQYAMRLLERAFYARALAAARAALGDGAFAAAWAEGQAMTLEQAVRAVLEEPQATMPMG